MADREKAVKGLEYCVGHHLCFGCGYYDPNNTRCQKELLRDALELLKEQEPVPPRKVKRYVEYGDIAINFPDTYDCGNCGEELPCNAKYCPACGRAVKWE